ncbi:MAG TPA: beta-L-arabinofuranosidase domain-containing protein [Anaerolineales bacterium]|nr:beta-L-arabinofuranosidase domain-containing protein [Anaerolineales bacterium]
MDEFPASQVTIADRFWTSRQLTNARAAIFHQWQELEDSRCIDNFRIAAGLKDGFRESWFFADSDAYKWLDAAARIQAGWPSEKLKGLIDRLVDLLGKAQMDDGYIFTYNQIHFPGERWGNLMIEHELYCHGHLIEAGVSHFEATGEQSALTIARKAADRLVEDFLSAPADRTSGHEEVEIALLRLYRLTRHAPYLDLATRFLERRGKVRPFAPLVLEQNRRVARRSQAVRDQRKAFLAAHPDEKPFELPPDNFAKRPATAKLRWMVNALDGKYFQQHAPIREQTVPVGHSVRFGYLETAIAMLYRINGDRSLLPAMEKAWECMVTRRMYITGGIGSLPELEGFGRDYELDPEIAYNETCAALASLFWNWELSQATGDARYADLFEWQLYNAAGVGIGLDGNEYLYNNPLLCRGGIARRSWFLVPCCPSNLSRAWASLGKYVYSHDDENLWVHQYLGNRLENAAWGKIRMDSGLPWEGKVNIQLEAIKSSQFTIHLRLPSWAANPSIRVNGEPVELPASGEPFDPQPASGYDPRLSRYVSIQRKWTSGDCIILDFDLPVVLRKASRRVRGHRNKVALTRGPLVYCLESVDNPGLDLFSTRIDPQSLRVADDPDLLGGIRTLRGRTVQGREFIAIPYPLWANRGESQMTVWVNT